MGKFFVLSVGLFLLVSVGSGCSTHTKTVTTETTHYAAESPQRPGELAQRSGEPVVVEKETTVKTETEREGESTGLLSGTVNVVGEILALPFRLVGGLISLVF